MDRFLNKVRAVLFGKRDNSTSPQRERRANNPNPVKWRGQPPRVAMPQKSSADSKERESKATNRASTSHVKKALFANK